jgi:hypothetical protein
MIKLDETSINNKLLSNYKKFENLEDLLIKAISFPNLDSSSEENSVKYKI